MLLFSACALEHQPLQVSPESGRMLQPYGDPPITPAPVTVSLCATTAITDHGAQITERWISVGSGEQGKQSSSVGVWR